MAADAWKTFCFGVLLAVLSIVLVQAETATEEKSMLNNHTCLSVVKSLCPVDP